jgi:hypothetical protein
LNRSKEHTWHLAWIIENAYSIFLSVGFSFRR